MRKHLKYYFILYISIALTGCVHKFNQSPDNSEKELQENLIKINKVLVKKDRQIIKGFISRSGYNMVETKTGLWYEIIEEGKGRKAEDGLIAKLNYTIKLLDGHLCYSSDESGPKTFLIGKGNVESGLQQGILFLNEGTKARFILPPHLAHGLPGDGERIPARAIIIYEVEIISLTNSE